MFAGGFFPKSDIVGDTDVSWRLLRKPFEMPTLSSDKISHAAIDRERSLMSEKRGGTSGFSGLRRSIARLASSVAGDDPKPRKEKQETALTEDDADLRVEDIQVGEDLFEEAPLDDEDFDAAPPPISVADEDSGPTDSGEDPIAGCALDPSDFDQSKPVYAALSRHVHLKQRASALRANIKAINENNPRYWRRRAQKFFDAVVDRGLFGADTSPPPGHLRSFDVLPRRRLQYNLVRGMNWYASNHGFFPQIFRPRRFTEKLLVTKFFAPVPMPSPGDKLNNQLYIPQAFRDEVKTPKRYWESHVPVIPEQFDAPPGVYYFKANHASGANLKVELPLNEEDHERLTALAKKWLAFDYGVRGGEWWYEMVHRKVYLEESFSSIGESTTDWKIFVLNGKATLIQVDLDRDQNHVQLLYDRDFTWLPCELFFKTGDPIEKPQNFDDIVYVAEAIGRQFEFARVDLYNTAQGLVLGEITLAPGGARLRLRSPELDMWMGEQWDSAFFKPGWRPRTSAFPF